MNWSGDRLREREGGITQRGVKLAGAAGRIVSRKRRGGFEDDDDEASLFSLPSTDDDGLADYADI